MSEQKMTALYEAFLDNLLALVAAGGLRPSDRAVIRLFLKDHGMAQRHPNRKKLQQLADIPLFNDDSDERDDDDHARDDH